MKNRGVRYQESGVRNQRTVRELESLEPHDEFRMVPTYSPDTWHLIPDT